MSSDVLAILIGMAIAVLGLVVALYLWRKKVNHQQTVAEVSSQLDENAGIADKTDFQYMNEDSTEPDPQEVQSKPFSF